MENLIGRSSIRRILLGLALLLVGCNSQTNQSNTTPTPAFPTPKPTPFKIDPNLMGDYPVCPQDLTGVLTAP